METHEIHIVEQFRIMPFYDSKKLYSLIQRQYKFLNKKQQPTRAAKEEFAEYSTKMLILSFLCQFRSNQ